MRTLEEVRPTEARVSLSAVVRNYRLLEELAGEGRVAAVVKADAYGHGMIPIARALSTAGCDRFAVSGLDEGLALREAGIEGLLLALFGIPANFARLAHREGVVPLVQSVESLLSLAHEARDHKITFPVHLNFDTGMGRLGIKPSELGELLEALRKSPEIKVEGVSTHFAKAGEGGSFTRKQLERFDGVLGSLSAAGVDAGLIHAANSAATFAEPKARYLGVRAGIALYGGQPAKGLAGAERLDPALEWVTKVLAVRKIPAGTPLSYGGTFTAPRDSVIATLPIGYADGFRRGLGNDVGHVLIHCCEAPIRGRVCMDLTLVDVTDLPEVRPGDEAVLIGRRGGKAITAEEVAAKLKTINYEVFCNIGKRVRRVYLP